jgi:hypothetical protein
MTTMIMTNPLLTGTAVTVPMPAVQLGRVEHDPEAANLGVGHRDADHRDGLPGAAQRQPGAAVDGLGGQLGVRLPAQQDRGQPGDVLHTVNGAQRGGHQPASVAHGGGLSDQGGRERDDVS